MTGKPQVLAWYTMFWQFEYLRDRMKYLKKQITYWQTLVASTNLRNTQPCYSLPHVWVFPMFCPFPCFVLPQVSNFPMFWSSPKTKLLSVTNENPKFIGLKFLMDQVIRFVPSFVCMSFFKDSLMSKICESSKHNWK